MSSYLYVVSNSILIGANDLLGLKEHVTKKELDSAHVFEGLDQDHNKKLTEKEFVAAVHQSSSGGQDATRGGHPPHAGSGQLNASNGDQDSTSSPQGLHAKPSQQVVQPAGPTTPHASTAQHPHPLLDHPAAGPDRDAYGTRREELAAM